MSTTEKQIFFDIFDTDEDEDSDYLDIPLTDLSFSSKKSTPNIGSLAYDYQQGTLKTPDFQREFVWSKKQACSFIETLLLDLPRPNIFFYSDEQYNNYIIDGQQRLKTIFCFLGILSTNDIPQREQDFINFRLDELSTHSPWYNKAYKDFSGTDQRKFMRRVMDVVTIQINNDEDKKVVYHIFKRLNTGGTKLTEQEIRNCIYTGKFNDLLHTLASNPTWQKLITLDKPQGRLKDVELILRFFALYDNLLSYNNPMKTFLSDYMQKKSNISGEEIQAKQKLFELTINSIDKHLQKNPFHTKNQLNSSVCDSIMIGFAKNLDNIPSDIQDRYKKLTRYNNEYETATSKSSNTKANVYKRIQLVESYLFPPKKLATNNDANGNGIKMYSFPVSGIKDFNLNDSKNYKYINLSEGLSDTIFSVCARGNEMSPTVNDGDLLLVSKETKPKNGDIVICKYRDTIMCRKILYSDKIFFLKLINTSRNQIKITRDNRNDFQCIGVVTSIKKNETITQSNS